MGEFGLGEDDAANIKKGLNNEQDRFSQLNLGDVEKAEHKSLEELTKEGNGMISDRRKHRRERIKIEGGTEAEAVQSIMNELYADKNNAVHQVLKQEKFYELLDGNYKKQLASLPLKLKLINALFSVADYQLPSVKSIKEKQKTLGEAKGSNYNKKFDQIISDASTEFLKAAEETVYNAGDVLKSLGIERESLANRIEDIEYKANDRADYVIELKSKIEDYDAGISKYQKEISKLKRADGNLSDEASEALRYKELVLQQYKNNKKIALESIRDCLSDIQIYDSTLTALKSKAKRTEATEGKLLDMYSGVKGNLEQFKQFIHSESHTAFLELFDRMEKLAKMNVGITGLLEPFDVYFKGAFETISNIHVETIKPDLDGAIGAAAASGKKFKEDLVENYRTKEIV